MSLTTITLSNFSSFYRPYCPLSKCPALSLVPGKKEWAAEAGSLDPQSSQLLQGKTDLFSLSVFISFFAALSSMQRNRAGSRAAGMGREHLGEVGVTGEASLGKTEWSEILERMFQALGLWRASVHAWGKGEGVILERKPEARSCRPLGMVRSVCLLSLEGELEKLEGLTENRAPHTGMFPEPWDGGKEGGPARITWVLREATGLCGGLGSPGVSTSLLCLVLRRPN